MKYTQNQISRNYRETKKLMRETRPSRCEDCGATTYLTPSHTIAQKDCKNYGITPVIWDELNIVIQCQEDHRLFEEGESHQESFAKRMAYLLGICHVLKDQIEEHTGPGKAEELAQRYLNKIKDDQVRLRWSNYWEDLKTKT